MLKTKRKNRNGKRIWIVKQIDEADHLNDLIIDPLYITMINLNKNYRLCAPDQIRIWK